MTEQKQKPDGLLATLGTFLEYIKTYGFFNIIKALMLLIIFYMVAIFCFNPSYILNKYTEQAAEQHQEEMEERTVHDSQLLEVLPSYIREFNASRVWIVQFHNGIADWTYGSMRFEVCAPRVFSIKEQYKDFPLSWLSLVGYLHSNEFFIGTVEELHEIDETIATQLDRNDVTHIACIQLHGSKGRIKGYFGVTWEGTPSLTNTQILNRLMKADGAIEQYI